MKINKEDKWPRSRNRQTSQWRRKNQNQNQNQIHKGVTDTDKISELQAEIADLREDLKELKSIIKLVPNVQHP